MQEISFAKLEHNHFALLLEWLQNRHVKAWWDSQIIWTPELIRKKYSNYAHGFKIENGIAKPINSYIIKHRNTPIGYLQYYNAYNFERSHKLCGLPRNLASFDFFIGEDAYLAKGFGTQTLILLLDILIKDSYEYIFVAPDVNNEAISLMKNFMRAT